MWKTYRRLGTTEMRPYVPGEDLTGISVSEQDTPQDGGMIARSSTNHEDQWYVNEAYFLANMEEVEEGACALQGDAVETLTEQLITAVRAKLALTVETQDQEAWEARRVALLALLQEALEEECA
jgi:hypothetical protein